MSGALVCDGELHVQAASPVCDGAWMLVQVPTPFDPSTLDPVTCAQAFGAGFIAVGTPLLACVAVRALIKMIKE